MNYMSKISAIYSDTLTEGINDNLFDRRKGKQIHDFIIDDLYAIETLPGIYVRDVELITDASKIDVRLNTRIIKNKKIIKNKIEKLISVHDTAYNALKFTIDIIGGQKVENIILIPKYIDRYHMLIDGKKTLTMWQVVDNLTYNKDGDVVLKTRINARLYKNKKKLTLVDDINNIETKVDTLNIDLFKKEFNPLYYFAAKKGIIGTIDYFGFTKYFNIVDTPTKPDIFYYFKINNNLYAEAEKNLFEDDSFFRSFCGMMTTLFTSRFKLDTIYNKDIWIKRLGTQFTSSSKNQYNKGLDVLRSFKNVLDSMAKSTARLPRKDKEDIYSIIRWALREFKNLRNQDDNDLRNKRIRVNEYIAASFGSMLKKKINYSLNMNPYDLDKLAKVFKFDEYVLAKSLTAHKEINKLFRYNMDVNDMQSINGLKFSFLGIQGLPGQGITDAQRDLYPSHVGRFELNAVSAGSPGVTGMLTLHCDIQEGGYFGKENNTPNEYRKKLVKKLKQIKEENKDLEQILNEHQDYISSIKDKNEWLLKYASLRNEDGYINIVRPKIERDHNGYMIMELKPKFIPYIRDEKGFIQISLKENTSPGITVKSYTGIRRLVFKDNWLTKDDN